MLLEELTVLKGNELFPEKYTLGEITYTPLNQSRGCYLPLFDEDTFIYSNELPIWSDTDPYPTAKIKNVVDKNLKFVNLIHYNDYVTEGIKICF